MAIENGHFPPVNWGDALRADLLEAIATIKDYRAVAGKAQGNPSDAFAELRRQSKLANVGYDELTDLPGARSGG